MVPEEIWPIILHLQGKIYKTQNYFLNCVSFSFFPNVIQPPIAILSNIIHSGLVRIGICRKVIRKFDMANPTGVTISIPGADQHDMERRRF